jgi:t-SNARE complex subunit (syntaxin)
MVAHFGPVSASEKYEQLKREWADAHPEATSEEYERAIREIAARLNY